MLQILFQYTQGKVALTMTIQCMLEKSTSIWNFEQ